jgi:hypothetical protein
MSVGSISSEERSVCGTYISLAGVGNNVSITATYEINIPMTTFNLFDKMRYLQTFFGTWTLDIIPILENMIIKVISIDVGAGAGQQTTNLCTHIRKSAAFQFYGVGNPCYYSVGVTDPILTWLKFTPQSYTINKANFYTSQFRLIPDRYISLASQFNIKPLQLPFIKVVSTPSGETFGNPGVANADIAISSVTKQAASKIDSLFITFHPSRSAKAICVQPYIKNFKLNVEEAGNNTYPGGGINMNSYNDHVQYKMLLDTLNLNNNSLTSLSSEYFRSCFPALSDYTYAAGGGNEVAAHDIFAADTYNFLLGIPFAADSSHMEGLARTSTDINWTIQGIVQYQPTGNIVENGISANHCIYSAVCDRNLILMSNYTPIPNQCYSTQTPLNI